jgi:hypothetical protein
MEAWMGAWNCTVHSFTSDWRELRTVVKTLKREEVVFNKQFSGFPSKRISDGLVIVDKCADVL